jgi:hypothetical protein
VSSFGAEVTMHATGEHAHTTWWSTPDQPALMRRIRAEFREMPGLRLTVSQAARLFGIESVRCGVLLHDLAAVGELEHDGDTFVSARTERPAV